MDKSLSASGYNGTNLTKSEYSSAYNKDFKLTKASSAYKGWLRGLRFYGDESPAKRSVDEYKMAKQSLSNGQPTEAMPINDVVKHYSQVSSFADAESFPSDYKSEASNMYSNAQSAKSVATAYDRSTGKEHHFLYAMNKDHKIKHLSHDELMSQATNDKENTDKQIVDLNKKLNLQHNIPLTSQEKVQYNKESLQMEQQKYIAKTPTMKQLYADRKIVTKDPNKALSTLYDSSIDKEPVRRVLVSHNIASRKNLLKLAKHASQTDLKPEDRKHDAKIAQQLVDHTKPWVTSSDKMIPISKNRGIRSLNKAKVRSVYDDVIGTNRFRRAVYYAHHPKAFKQLKRTIDKQDQFDKRIKESKPSISSKVHSKVQKDLSKGITTKVSDQSVNKSSKVNFKPRNYHRKSPSKISKKRAMKIVRNRSIHR